MSANGMRFEITTITPEYATELLGMNLNNRKISNVNLNQVKESLTKGEWKLNGEAIKIATDGRVLDGQHRLTACAQTGVSFATAIVFGLDEDTRDTMDSGKSRTPADALALRGHKSAVTLAAITASVLRYERWGIRPALGVSSSYPVTVSQIVARAEADPVMKELAGMAFSARRAGLTAKTAGLLHYVFSSIDSVDAEYFMDKLASGEGLERGNPILALRNSLIAMKTERGTKSQPYIGAIVVKAWNKFRAGEQVLHLRFNPGGANPESYPEPI